MVVVAKDESFTDKGFEAFKKQLASAVKRRDVAQVVAVASPQVKTGFGMEDEGPEALRRLLGAEEGWTALSKTLAMGCAKTADGEFSCPALFSRAPDELDWTQHAIVVGAPGLRASPEERSKARTRPANEVIKVIDAGKRWTRVRTLDGVEGHVRSSQLYMPLGPRTGFIRQDGRWVMRFFVLGGD